MTTPGGGQQLQLNARCRRCGAELVDDAGLLEDLERALHDIDRAKMRWPVGVAGDLRVVAAHLRCRTGACQERNGG